MNIQYIQYMNIIFFALVALTVDGAAAHFHFILN